MVRRVASLLWLAVGCGACEPAPATRRPVATTLEPGPEQTESAQRELEPRPEPTPMPDPLVAASQAIDPDGAPSARMDHVAVYTGSQLIVWGGDDAYPSEVDDYAPVAPNALATGGRYHLAQERWSTTTVRGAPAARYDARAVYGADRMIVWGGLAAPGAPLGDGGRYDPAGDRWQPMSRRGAPSARSGHSMVWTGAEAIVWGGGGTSVLSDGARYDPAADRWTPIASANAPSARRDHSAVWTGEAMIIWGGRDASGDRADGGRYDLATDRWTPLPAAGAPTPRRDHIAVWTGGEMILWGGVAGDGDRVQILSSGAIYSPERRAFRPMSTERAFGRVDDAGVWSGGRFVVIGEVDGDTELYPRPTLGVYDPLADSWSYFGAVATLDRPVVLGGDELISWGGHDGTNLLAEGERIRVPPTPR